MISVIHKILKQISLLQPTKIKVQVNLKKLWRKYITIVQKNIKNKSVMQHFVFLKIKGTF